MMTEPMVLEFEHVSKRYRNGKGVNGISLQVRRGDIFGFFGPNGAGKTTLMKIAAGLCRADKGRVRMFGHDVGERFEAAMRRTGVLIEKAEAFDYLSGRQNLALAARLYPDLPKCRIDEVLELVGLSASAGEKAGHYSLGMKQRLGVASALLSRPELLILDEPTNGLDIEGMAEIRELIARLARESGITFFVSSHLISEMEMICSRIGILHEGRLIREGRISDLADAPGQSLEAYFIHQIHEEREAARHGASESEYHQ